MVENSRFPLEFDDICHTFGDASTSGLGACDISISGCPSMSHLFVVCVVEKFAFAARIKIILNFGGIRLYEST